MNSTSLLCSTVSPLLLLIATLAPRARAATIPPNSVGITLPGTSLAERPELAGTIIADRTDPANPLLDFRTYVVREAASGTLDFYYEYIAVGTTTGFGQRPVSLTNVSGFDTSQGIDLAYRTDLGGAALFQIAADSSNSSFPHSGYFVFGPGDAGAAGYLADNAFTTPVFIHTDAINFATSGTIYGIPDYPDPFGLGYFRNAFVPAPASVPEPRTLPCLTLALTALAWRWREHRPAR